MDEVTNIINMNAHEAKIIMRQALDAKKNNNKYQEILAKILDAARCGKDYTRIIHKCGDDDGYVRLLRADGYEVNIDFSYLPTNETHLTITWN